MSDLSLKIGSEAVSTKDIPWIVPTPDSPAPRGRKMMLYSIYGVVSMGVWNERFHAGWFPIPQVTLPLRAAVDAKLKGITYES
jgi:hypothetical protein